MTKQGNGSAGPVNEQGATAGHNSETRSQIIKECAAEFRRIKEERKSLNEDAKGARERLKAIGINAKGFEAGLRIADMDDDAARDEFMESVRETFESLGISDQMDWVAISERAGARAQQAEA